MIKIIALGVVAVALVGCGYKDAGIAATCEQWDYVIYSRNDTIGTINQSFELNTRRDAFCKGIDPIELRLK